MHQTDDPKNEEDELFVSGDVNYLFSLSWSEKNK